MDIFLMNQEKLNRFLLSGEKIIKKPSNFPPLPVDTLEQLKCLENFLNDDGNLSAAVSVFTLFYYFISCVNLRLIFLFSLYIFRNMLTLLVLKIL